MFFEKEEMIATINIKSKSFHINEDIEMICRDPNITEQINNFKDIYDFHVFGHINNGKNVFQLNLFYKENPFAAPLTIINIKDKYIEGMVLTDVAKEIEKESVITLKKVCFLQYN